MTHIEPSIVAALAAHIDSHNTSGFVWPDSAEYAVEYNCSTWPMGWGKDTVIVFFDDREAYDKWVVDHRKWAELEDNYLAFRAWQWDWGPTLMQGEGQLEAHLGPVRYVL